MSVEALAIALHHSRAKGTARLVLIGIANHDGDGGSWPSIDTLSIYAGGVDHRTVQRGIDELERLGEVRRIIQAGGTRSTADHRRPNLYEVRLACPPDCDRSKHHRTRRTPRPATLDVQLRDGEWVLEPDDSTDSPPVEELSTGVAWAPPVELSTRVAPTPPVRVAPTPPEPSYEAKRTRELTRLTTAREAESGDPPLPAHLLEAGRCLDGTHGHEWSRRSRWCIYCGIDRAYTRRRDPASGIVLPLPLPEAHE